MPNIQEILKQIQKDLYCPVCGHSYEQDQIKVRGFFDKTIIIQTICPNGHSTVFMTTFQEKILKSEPAMTADDSLDLANALKDFDGNFETLWAK